MVVILERGCIYEKELVHEHMESQEWKDKPNVTMIKQVAHSCETPVAVPWYSVFVDRYCPLNRGDSHETKAVQRDWFGFQSACTGLRCTVLCNTLRASLRVGFYHLNRYCNHFLRTLRFSSI